MLFFLPVVIQVSVHCPALRAEPFLVFSLNVEDTRGLTAGRGTCVCSLHAREAAALSKALML